MSFRHSSSRNSNKRLNLILRGSGHRLCDLADDFLDQCRNLSGLIEYHKMPSLLNSEIGIDSPNWKDTIAGSMNMIGAIGNVLIFPGYYFMKCPLEKPSICV